MNRKKLHHAIGVLLSTLATAACAAPFAYIANSGGNNVSVIDTATDTVTTTIPVGAVPYYVAVAPGGKRIYVTNCADNSLSVIDGTSNTVIATIPVGDAPMGVAVGLNGTRVVVANQADQTATVIDAGSNTVVGTIPVGGHPEAVSFMKFYNGNGYFLVTLPATDTVVQVDATSLQTGMSRKVGEMPRALATDFPYIYASGEFDGTLAKIDTFTGPIGVWFPAQMIPVGSDPMGLAATPWVFPPNQSEPSLEVLVAKSSANSLAVVNAQTLTTIADIPVGHWPIGVAVTPSGAKAYVTNYSDNTVSAIDTHTHQVVATIPVGVRPVSIGRFIQPFGDYTPDAFAFTSVFGAQPSNPLLKAPNWLISDSVTVSGIDEPVAASVSCPAAQCALSVDGGAWTNYASNVGSGQWLRVRLAASTGYFTTTTARLHVGPREASFSVTTKMLVKFPKPVLN